MTVINRRPGIFLLALLLSVASMATTGWSAPAPKPEAKPVVIINGEQSTPVDGNMDHVVGEDLC